MPNKDYETFESRKTTLEKILSALRDPEVNMLGIYGMGGIGKTTLAKEVGRKAMIEKLFNQVVFVEVSQSQDQVRNVEGQIADKLGLSFSEESESGRARSLCGRLKKEEKILVILDNIWDKLDLLVVGVPHGDHHKGCKIMLTSRSEDTLLQKMDCERNIVVGVLEDEEAWILFKKLAGDHIESTVLKSVAKAVLDKCARLPVSIVTVARALRRNKSLAVWNDALEKLRRPFSSNFKDVQGEAFLAIELSYNMLPGEELKKVFLLIGCTQITTVDWSLIHYCMGMCLFEGIYKLKEARDRVCSVVQRLKATCLLLEHETKSQERFSMHDVIRDVALSIAFRDQTAVMVTKDQFNQWEQRDEREAIPYTWIFFLHVNTSVLGERLESPRLKLLSLNAKLMLQIPDHFFSGMKQMRVLNLKHIHLIPLPSSLGFLTNLQTLCLHFYKLQDLGFLGGLKQLQILSLLGSNIRKLPVELSQLTRLMLLDMRQCYGLEVIPPNVLSKLSHLEELYIEFTKWAMKVEGVENASHEELTHLPNLTSLDLKMEMEALPSGFFFEQLERYEIFVRNFVSGSIFMMTYKSKYLRCSKTLVMKVHCNIKLKDRLVIEQLWGIENLKVYQLQEQDIKYFSVELLKNGSFQMRHLEIQGDQTERSKEPSAVVKSGEIVIDDETNDICSTLFVQKVALPNLETLELHWVNVERIWQSQQVSSMICSGVHTLRCLILKGCRNLRCVFPSSISRSFVQLQELEIEDCPVLEELVTVVDQELEERKTITLPRLQSITMRNLKRPWRCAYWSSTPERIKDC